MQYSNRWFRLVEVNVDNNAIHFKSDGENDTATHRFVTVDWLKSTLQPRAVIPVEIGGRLMVTDQVNHSFQPCMINSWNWIKLKLHVLLIMMHLFLTNMDRWLISCEMKNSRTQWWKAINSPIDPLGINILAEEIKWIQKWLC